MNIHNTICMKVHPVVLMAISQAWNKIIQMAFVRTCANQPRTGLLQIRLKKKTFLSKRTFRKLEY